MSSIMNYNNSTTKSRKRPTSDMGGQGYLPANAFTSVPIPIKAHPKYAEVKKIKQLAMEDDFSEVHIPTRESTPTYHCLFKD